MLSLTFEFRILHLERDNLMGMLRVYDGDNFNLETKIKHLTKDITLATRRNKALKTRVADLECRLAEWRAMSDYIDKNNQDR